MGNDCRVLVDLIEDTVDVCDMSHTAANLRELGGGDFCVTIVYNNYSTFTVTFVKILEA